MITSVINLVYVNFFGFFFNTPGQKRTCFVASSLIFFYLLRDMTKGKLHSGHYLGFVMSIIVQSTGLKILQKSLFS